MQRCFILIHGGSSTARPTTSFLGCLFSWIPVLIFAKRYLLLEQLDVVSIMSIGKVTIAVVIC